MQLLDILPHLNAILNVLSSVLLIFGFYFIKQKEIQKHRAAMLSAFVTSCLFLFLYVTHHTIRTYYFGLGPTKFTGEGIIRPIYFFILTTHTILATVIAPFIIFTLSRALKGTFEIHKKFARFVFPIWLYVSITGVVVYIFLYQIYTAR
jgi:putative membrane protein